jgi:hypothetical protein
MSQPVRNSIANPLVGICKLSFQLSFSLSTQKENCADTVLIECYHLRVIWAESSFRSGVKSVKRNVDFVTFTPDLLPFSPTPSPFSSAFRMDLVETGLDGLD